MLVSESRHLRGCRCRSPSLTLIFLSLTLLVPALFQSEIKEDTAAARADAKSIRRSIHDCTLFLADMARLQQERDAALQSELKRQRKPQLLIRVRLKPIVQMHRRSRRWRSWVTRSSHASM
jgi:hypothetical protein